MFFIKYTSNNNMCMPTNGYRSGNETKQMTTELCIFILCSVWLFLELCVAVEWANEYSWFYPNIPVSKSNLIGLY